MTARNYKHYDPEKFLQDLAQIPWCSNLLMDDVNEKVARFDTHFLNTLERHAPFKTMKIRYRQCPFLNDEIKELMKNRDNLHKIARQTRMQSDWEKFRMCRESVKRKLREAERKYVQNEIYNSNKSRSMWKVIRDCVPRKETTELNYSRNVEELAEEFNVFFTSMGVRAAEAAAELAAQHYLPTLYPQALVDIPESDQFRLYPVSCYEIQKIVMSFSSNKAPGSDKVSMSVIKDALPCILPILTQIVNCSLLTTVFPTAWKKAEVIPLVKEGDHEIPNNNRPVSLLVAASKICERVVLNQLTEYMINKKKFTKHQSGNRKLHSTEILNIFITDTILESMDRKEVTALVLLDLSKAFDSIDHVILCRKLQSIGVSRFAMDWFKSYLSDRSQYVRIGSTTSQALTITRGVPQGSILGPLLFNIYISFPIVDAETAATKLSEDMNRITTWWCSNSLLVNPAGA